MMAALMAVIYLGWAAALVMGLLGAIRRAERRRRERDRAGRLLPLRLTEEAAWRCRLARGEITRAQYRARLDQTDQR